MVNYYTKKKVQESITNLSNMGVIPADEVQLNLDVIYNSVLEHICSIVPMESPRQIISCLKLIFGSKNKSNIKITDPNSKDNTDVFYDVFKKTMMEGFGAFPINDNGYPSDEVNCSVVFDENGFCKLPYHPILPGTIKAITANKTEATDSINNLYLSDDKHRYGELIDINDQVVAYIDYDAGVIKKNQVELDTIKYKYDIYNLEYQRNFAQFVKKFVETFAQLYILDLDSASILNDIKLLDIKKNIKNILPQVLTQQIDQYIINKYFDYVSISGKFSEYSLITYPNIVDIYNSGLAQYQIYEDIGIAINKEAEKFTKATGCVPNVLIVNPKAYYILSINKKFKALEEDDDYACTPRLIGYFNNMKVILSNEYNDINIVLTYKGPSQAQSAGVYCPYIPVSLRTVTGMESGGMIDTNNAYSMAGFEFINPELIRGIMIKEVAH